MKDDKRTSRNHAPTPVASEICAALQVPGREVSWDQQTPNEALTKLLATFLSQNPKVSWPKVTVARPGSQQKMVT